MLKAAWDLDKHMKINQQKWGVGLWTCLLGAHMLLLPSPVGLSARPRENWVTCILGVLHARGSPHHPGRTQGSSGLRRFTPSRKAPRLRWLPCGCHLSEVALLTKLAPTVGSHRTVSFISNLQECLLC